jgi:hypothetical protein
MSMLTNVIGAPGSGWTQVYELAEPRTHRGDDGAGPGEVVDGQRAARALAELVEFEMKERRVPYAVAMETVKSMHPEVVAEYAGQMQRGAKRRRPARELLDSLVRERIAQTGASYVDALREIVAEAPTLYAQANDEIRD